MEVSRKIMRLAGDLLDDGRAFALCTVVAARGSVPGRVGAKMIVLPDGQQHGTVGGAGLELRVHALALECLRKRRSASQRYDLAFFKEGGLDSLCGGTVDVLVEYMAPRPHLLICGGGHVGLEVARLSDQLEYPYSVLDDRAEFVARARFPGARALHHTRPEQFFPTADLTPYSDALILGYSHQVDTEVLYQCLQRFPGHVGLICSRLKRKQMWKRLQARGVSEQALARVEAPIGLPIGADSPAEIAVAILGGVIARHKQREQQNREENHEADEADQDRQGHGAAQVGAGEGAATTG